VFVKPPPGERAPRHDDEPVAAGEVERGGHEPTTGALSAERVENLGVQQVEEVAIAVVDESSRNA
jgi:hypothetical protein